jgi:hypothetical protein
MVGVFSKQKSFSELTDRVGVTTENLDTARMLNSGLGFFNSAFRKLNPEVGFAQTLEKSISGVGGVLAGIDLGKTIADNWNKKWSYDDTKRAIGDITGVASSALTLAGLAPVGAALTIAETAGTKLADVIKAEIEGKPNNFGEFAEIAEKAVLPKVMTDDVKDVWREDIKPKYDEALNWVQLWGDMSKEGRERRKEYKEQKKKDRIKHPKTYDKALNWVQKYGDMSKWGKKKK